MKKFISVVLSIVLYLTVFSLVILWSTRDFLSVKVVQKEMQKIDFTKIVEDQYSGQNALYQDMERYGISKVEVDRIWESDFVKEATGRIVGNMSEYIVTGKETELLTVKEWDALVDAHAEDLITQIKPTLTNSQKEAVVDILKNQGPNIIKQIPKATEITDTMGPAALETVRFALGNTLKFILLGISLLIGALLIWIQYKKGKWILYIGIPLLLSGMSLFAFGSLCSYIFQIALEGESVAVVSFGNALVAGYQAHLFLPSMILIGVSIVSFIGYLFVRKVHSHA